LIDDPFADTSNSDGKAIKICDQLAAYIEAYVSEKYGITSKALSSGKDELKVKLLSADTKIDIRGLLERLDEMDI
jgi:hypothetical protein